MNAISHQIQLLRRPTGLPTLEDFALRDVPPLPALQEGEVQVANQWLSVDPYMRGRMSEAKATFLPSPQRSPRRRRHRHGTGIAPSRFQGGDKVSSMLGWRDAFVANAAQLTRLPDTTLPPQRFLGALGMPGMTAWAGLHKVAHLKAGETLLVSAASAVGTMAVQLAKQAGPGSSAPPARPTRSPTSRPWEPMR